MTSNKPQGHTTCVAKVPIFNHLSEEEMREIAKAAHHAHFERGDFLYRSGEHADQLYIVHKGRVKIFQSNAEGKEQLIRILEPGDFTGELALFTHSAYVDYAEVMEASELCIVSKAKLNELMLEHPAVAIKILQEMSLRLAKVEQMLNSFAGEEVETRLARYLLEQEESGGSSVIRLGMTRKDLASYLGTTPETISRRLGRFADKGWIEQHEKGEIRILDRQALLSLPK